MVVEGDNFVYYLENFVMYHFDFDIISIMLYNIQLYVLLIMILCNKRR